MPKGRKAATENVEAVVGRRLYARRSELTTTARLSCSQIGYEAMRAMKLVAS